MTKARRIQDHILIEIEDPEQQSYLGNALEVLYDQFHIYGLQYCGDAIATRDRSSTQNFQVGVNPREGVTIRLVRRGFDTFENIAECSRADSTSIELKIGDVYYHVNYNHI
jgi:hypothetical protein